MPDPRNTLLRISLGAVLFVVLVMTAVPVLQTRRESASAFAERAERMARILASACLDDVARLDVRGLRVRLASWRLDPDVASVYVTDAQGVVLADGTPENPRRGEKIENLFTAELLRVPRWMSVKADGVLRVGGPIEAADGTVVGFVLADFSPPSGAVVGVAVAGMLAALVCVIACAGLFWVAGRRVSRRPTGEMMPAPAAVPKTATQEAGPEIREEEKGLPPAVVEHLLGRITDAVLVVGPDGRIASTNEKARELTGYEPEDLSGETLGMVLGEEAADLDELIARTATTRLARTLSCKDGDRRPVWLSTVVVRNADGSVREVLCVLSPVGGEGGEAAEEVSAERERLAEERLALEAERERLESARAEVESLRARIREAEEALHGVEAERTAALTDRQAAEEARREALRELAEIREKLQRAQEDLARERERSVQAAEQASGSEAAALNDQIEQARREAQAAREAAERSRTESGEARREAETARADAESARRELADARREAEAARSEADRLRTKLEEISPRADEDVERLQRELEESKALLNQAREERDLMAQELEKTQAYWKGQEERWKKERAAAQAAGEGMAAGAAVGPVEAATDAAAEETVLDVQEALAGVDGDMEFLKALVDVFMESSARQMAEIGAAIDRGDAASLERTARMLKGVVSTFGARAAAAAALQLETIGIVGDLDRAQEAYEKLDAEIERLKPALVELVSGGRS